MDAIYTVKDVDIGTRSIVNVSLPSEVYIGQKKKDEIEDRKIPDMGQKLDQETLKKFE